MSSSPTEHADRGRRCRRWASRSPRGRSSNGASAPGDWVEADETICDVTTDKVDVEIPAPASGTPGGDPGRAGRDGGGRHRDRSRIGRRARQAGAGPVTDSEPPPLRSSGSSGPVPRFRATRRRWRRRSTGPGSTRPLCGGSPRSMGSTSTQVEGTGVGGRVRKTDLLAFLESAARRSRAEAAAHGVALQARAGGGRERRRPAANGASCRPSGASRCRRCGGRSPSTCSTSRRTAAHCTTIVEVDFSRVAARRAELRETRWRGGAST